MKSKRAALSEDERSVPNDGRAGDKELQQRSQGHRMVIESLDTLIFLILIYIFSKINKKIGFKKMFSRISIISFKVRNKKNWNNKSCMISAT